MKRLAAFSLLFSLCAAASLPPQLVTFKRTHTIDLTHKSKNGHFQHSYQDFYEEGFMIGSQFRVGFWILDTTTDKLTVATCPKNLTDALNSKLNCFNPAKSETFVKTSETSGIDYVMPFSREYVNMTQEFSLIPFGQVTPNMNGIVGMNWPVNEPANFKPFPTNMLSHFDKNMFTLAFSNTACQSFIKFGDLLPYSQCHNDEIKYAPVTSTSNWQFALTGFQFGPVNDFSHSQAIVASATGYIGLPGKQLKRMMQFAQIPWNATVGAYVTACNRTDLPDFKFSAAGSTLTIPASQYLYQQQPLHPYGSNRCVVNFEDSDSSGFGPQWYFGHPLMGSYCVNFDFDRKRIGFSPNTIATDMMCTDAGDQ